MPSTPAPTSDVLHTGLIQHGIAIVKNDEHGGVILKELLRLGYRLARSSTGGQSSNVSELPVTHLYAEATEDPELKSVTYLAFKPGIATRAEKNSIINEDDFVPGNTVVYVRPITCVAV